MSTLRYWVWLSLINGLGGEARSGLFDTLRSPEQIYFAGKRDYERLGFLKEIQIQALMDKRLDAAARVTEECDSLDIRIVTRADAEYPKRLDNVYNPPILLYVKGRLPDIDNEPIVGMVGTRSCTPYGIKTAERISYEFTKAGGIVVTGLAKGIDAAAAKGALRAGGKLIGVVGNGVDVIYPYESASLYHDTAAVGAIISEYPPGTRPSKYTFPARNRIMSGLSLGVAVIEAPAKSGALITASYALEQGRDVFAVPGNVDSASCEGSNELLKDGAIPITSGWDISEEYKDLFPAKLGSAKRIDTVPIDGAVLKELVADSLPKQPKAAAPAKKVIDKKENVEYIDLGSEENLPEITLDGDERTVALIMTEPDMLVDDIINKSGLSASRVLATLTLMEIREYITQSPGKRFTLKVTVK